MRSLASLLVTLALASAACGDDTGGTGGTGGGGQGGGDAIATTTATTGTASTAGTGGEGGGAGGEGGEGGGTPLARGVLEATWSITIDGEEADCFALGAEWVDVAVIPEGAGGEPIVTRLTCLDGSGTTDELPLGDYEVAVSLVNFDEEVVAEPAQRTASITEDGATVALDPIEFAVEGGRFDVSWIITEGGEPATCGDAGASHAEYVLTNLDTFLTYGTSFPCDAGQGTTTPVPLGTYEISPALLDFDVILFNVEPFQIELVDPGAVERVPEVEFDITPPV